jgi:stress response protein YsnF
MMGILDKLFGTEDDSSNQNNQGNQGNQGTQGTQNNTNTNNNNNGNEEATLQLRKEELDINKNKVQAGEVILGKQVIEDQQSVNVPVTHEELVIERRPLNNQACDSQITSDTSSNSSSNSSSSSSISDNNCENIRIPLTEEQVDVNKKTVVTEEIKAYKRDVEQNQKIEQTLKREEARVDTKGNAAIAQDSDITGNSNNNKNNNNNNNTNDNNTDNSTSSFQ